MTRSPQYLNFLHLGLPDDIVDHGTKGELRIWWTLVTFVVVYLAYVIDRAVG
jgi:hypothetical protein